MKHDTEDDRRHEESHHDPQQQLPAAPADRDVTGYDRERERDEEERHELRRILVMREQQELGAGARPGRAR